MICPLLDLFLITLTQSYLSYQTVLHIPSKPLPSRLFFFSNLFCSLLLEYSFLKYHPGCLALFIQVEMPHKQRGLPQLYYVKESQDLYFYLALITCIYSPKAILTHLFPVFLPQSNISSTTAGYYLFDLFIILSSEAKTMVGS